VGGVLVMPEMGSIAISIYVVLGASLYFFIPFFVTKEEEKGEEERLKARFNKRQELQKEYGHLSPEEIIFNGQIEYVDKLFLLEKVHNYSNDEAEELYDASRKEAKKAKLSEVKRKISQKAQETYGNIPSDDERKSIPDEVKMYVWQRDRGKCVKCGSQKNLEYDHDIPVSKGGGNTARNIRILCENCNRTKSNNIA